MKGFIKDGKFRPTENRTKSALTKADLRKKDDLEAYHERFRLLDSKTATNPRLMEKRKKEEQLKKIDELTKEIEKHWYSEGEELSDEDEGIDFFHIFTSKEDPKLTYEIHYMEDEFDEDGVKEPSRTYNAWYWFDAKDGKGIPSSPERESESGGYTVHDVYQQYLEDILRDYPEGLK